MTTYTINLQVEGERAVGIVAALHADGYHAEATEINRQVHAQREAAIRIFGCTARRKNVRPPRPRKSTNSCA